MGKGGDKPFMLFTPGNKAGRGDDIMFLCSLHQVTGLRGRGAVSLLKEGGRGV